MWLEQATLAFLVVAVAVMEVPGLDSVMLDDKKSRSVKVPFGSPINLKCNLSTTQQDRVWVVWLFNPSGPSVKEAKNISAKIRFVKTTSEMDRVVTALHHTSSATDENSGWYFCKVTEEIPKLNIIYSNGTEVIITTTNNSLLLDWWLWILLGVSALVLIVLLIACLVLSRRCCRSREEPVYGNTHSVANKQPSPRPGMPVDNLKTVSSCQQLRNQRTNRRKDEGKQSHGQ